MVILKNWYAARDKEKGIFCIHGQRLTGEMIITPEIESLSISDKSDYKLISTDGKDTYKLYNCDMNYKKEKEFGEECASWKAENSGTTNELMEKSADVAWGLRIHNILTFTLEPKPKNMVTRESWENFRGTGLLWFINTILHVFGWAICVDVDPDTKEVIDSYPSRVKFRGFEDKYNDDGYKKVTKYMLDNVNELYKDTLD